MQVQEREQLFLELGPELSLGEVVVSRSSLVVAGEARK